MAPPFRGIDASTRPVLIQLALSTDTQSHSCTSPAAGEFAAEQAYLLALALPLNNGSFELRDVPAGSTSLSAERPESKFLSVISTFT